MVNKSLKIKVVASKVKETKSGKTRKEKVYSGVYEMPENVKDFMQLILDRIKERTGDNIGFNDLDIKISDYITF